MPRQIEVQSADGSTWEVWNSPADPRQYPWRYVGGVLENFGERMADLEARVRAEFAAQFETRVATEVRKRLETAIDDVKRRMT